MTMRAVLAEAAAKGLSILPDGSGIAPRAIASAGRAAASGGTHPRTICPMNLGEILSGVALLQPLAPELAQAPSPPSSSIRAASLRESLFFAFPAVRPTAASSPPMRWRAARWPWSANRPRRPILRTVDSSGAWTAGALACRT